MKKYVSPELVMIRLDENDIITTSGGLASAIIVNGEIKNAVNQGSQDFSIWS